MLVHGRVRDDSYADRDGVRRTAYVIEAVALGHNLARGLTRFAKRTGGDGARMTGSPPSAEPAAGGTVAGGTGTGGTEGADEPGTAAA